MTNTVSFSKLSEDERGQIIAGLNLLHASSRRQINNVANNAKLKEYHQEVASQTNNLINKLMNKELEL